MTGQPREGAEEYNKIDVANYTRRVFSMFSGKEYRVKLRFINRLLDTAVERFGRKGDTQEDYRFWGVAPIYSKLDDNHFTVEATVEVSDQFYGWLLGFGRMVKILEPEPVVAGFTEYYSGSAGVGGYKRILTLQWYDLETQQVLAEESFEGGRPPYTIDSDTKGAQYGSYPDEEVLEVWVREQAAKFLP